MMKFARIAVVLSAVALLISTLPCSAKQQQAHKATPTATGVVYPQFLYHGNKYARWIPQQMPIKVWVSHGLTLDNIVDPATGAPVTNTANTAHWGDAVVQVLESGQMNSLPVADPYNEQMYGYAVNGVKAWQGLNREGLFSYDLTEDPNQADVYVFWTKHFVNKLGMALFENDTRGLTSKWLLPSQSVISAIEHNDLELIRRSRKPVVIILRTTASDGLNMMMPRDMQAAAAHEMGHALGIDGHSTNPADLMSLHYAQGQPNPNPSINDLATMRYLYRHPADMIP
jgi:Matrixin